MTMVWDNAVNGGKVFPAVSQSGSGASELGRGSMLTNSRGKQQSQGVSMMTATASSLDP